MTEYRLYDSLPDDAVFIRRKVFVEEQHFEEEFDERDKSSSHIVLYIEGTPAAVCRYFYDDKLNSYVVGRIAVIKEFRGRNIGSDILREAQTHITKLGGKKIMLAAQTRARGFYEKQGYTACGSEFMEEYCPHIWMYKNIQSD